MILYYDLKVNSVSQFTITICHILCCLYRYRTISGKVDAVISCRVKLYRSWIRLPVASSVRMDFQCLRYRTLVSGSSGNTSGPTRFSMGVLAVGDTVRRCFVTGPGSGATALFIGGFCLASGLSCWARCDRKCDFVRADILLA